MNMLEFFDWLARIGGAITILATLLGFMFREKWKQILAKSLASDIEHLKAELAKQHATHSATLAPMIESAKYEFQEKLEAYKVGLIAETERIKAQNELKKSIALRMAEVELERLLALELALSPTYSFVIVRATQAPNERTLQHMTDCNKTLEALSIAVKQAQMFLSNDDHLNLLQYIQSLSLIVANNTGPDNPPYDTQSPDSHQLVLLSNKTHKSIKAQIMGLTSRN